MATAQTATFSSENGAGLWEPNVVVYAVAEQHGIVGQRK